MLGRQGGGKGDMLSDRSCGAGGAVAPARSDKMILHEAARVVTSPYVSHAELPTAKISIAAVMTTNDWPHRMRSACGVDSGGKSARMCLSSSSDSSVGVGIVMPSSSESDIGCVAAKQYTTRRSTSTAEGPATASSRRAAPRRS